MDIKIPDTVVYIIGKFINAGYEAYAVGGCIRDTILGRIPKDWDVCTSALPEETMRIFAKHHIIKTGLQHGTVTLRLNKESYEITTYRRDGAYSDNRHPDTVDFVNDLYSDLSRRDFTINAMAYNPDDGVKDFFGGKEDLGRGVIRCVGAPKERFGEDALRIMRALRFAAELGFDIDNKTSEAMLLNRGLLKNIAVERIAMELNRMIMGSGICELVLNHLPVICEIISEIKVCTGEERDILNNSLKIVDNMPEKIHLRLAGFMKVIAETPDSILRRLKYDNNSVRIVSELVKRFDRIIPPDKAALKKELNEIGEERFIQLTEIWMAKTVVLRENERKLELERLRVLTNLLKEITVCGECYSLDELAINGKDLVQKGYKGTEIGAKLKQLLEMVIEDKVENNREVLLGVIASQQDRVSGN